VCSAARSKLHAAISDLLKMASQLLSASRSVVLVVVVQLLYCSSVDATRYDDKPLVKRQNTCQNGGSALSATDSNENELTVCQCPAPYYGQSCEKDERTCSSDANICQNGGQMRTQHNAIYCDCSERYFGARCQERCPDGFSLLDQGDGPVACVKVLLTSKTYFDHMSACRRLDKRARLVVSDWKAKNDAVKDHIRAIPVRSMDSCKVWFGPTFSTAGQRKVNGDCSTIFYWKPDGEKGELTPLSFNDWNGGEPNCFLAAGMSPESCLTFQQAADFRWNDASCEYLACSVCEIPA